MRIKRGHVYVVDLDPTQGHEIRKTRPAVVVSNNDLNEISPIVLVMPITTGTYEYVLRIPIAKSEGGLHKQSVIATEHIRAVDKSRLQKCLGKVSMKTMQRIEKALYSHFDLPF